MITWGNNQKFESQPNLKKQDEMQSLFLMLAS